MADGNAKSLKNILNDLGENSSVHGIPKILSSKNMLLKIFWLVVFLGTTAYLCLQMYALFEDYYTYPVETTVSLKFSAIRYPDITFCNMNPIKKSMLHHTPQSLQDTLKPKESKSAPEGDVTYNSEDDYYYYSYEYDYHYENEEYQDEIDEYFSDPNPLQEEYLRLQSPDVPKDRWTDRKDKFKTEYRKMHKYEKQYVGHQLNDMIVSCTFNKRRCNISYFQPSISSEYGACYTLSSEDFIARKPGHLHGLQVILNLEVSEYITPLSSAYGIKMVVHQPQTVPFPSVEGLTLSSRQETTMSLRKLEINRLGGNYGNCEDSVLQDNGMVYSQTFCLNTCVNLNVIDQCECLPNTLDYAFYKPEYDRLEYCESEDFEKMVCQFDIEKQQLDGTLNCDCPTPCSEVLYTKTLSSRTWPHDEYLRQFLMAKVCAKNMTSASEACEIYKKDSKNFITESVVDNFLAVNIYFEDVNYEVITESAKYDEFQVLASIGGNLGLFVGASVLSFVEVIHVVLEVGIYFLQSRVKKDEISSSKSSVKV
ncbi:degenerin mec-10-like [Ylistrum balloti]|uniref:degenerin mec-10-like n=1 Tax=Ylistrum balloti TaxID=509963 RepID=UPI002905EAF6|nr:degenerin mec-10-like [Ylistrum balloti]